MYCKYCGYQNNDDNCFCTNCGAAIRETEVPAVKSIDKKRQNKEIKTALWVLGFLLPLIGLIVWIAMMNSDPVKARSAGKGALWGAILLPALILIVYIVFIIMVAIFA